jgi:excisionase family DNA binding protein
MDLTKMDLASDGFCDLAEAEYFLGVGRVTLLRMIRNGIVPTACFGSSHRRVPRRWLKEWAANQITTEKDDVR